MALNRIRIDRFISQYLQNSRRDVRLMLAQKRVEVDGEIILDIDVIIDNFSIVKIDGKTVQHNAPHYVMLHKPVGVVSATVDEQHTTVIDLIKTSKLLTNEQCENLHIVGRLDLNTTGLVLLTNDSRWSSKLTAPENKVTKQYLVTLAEKLTLDYINAFAQGMYFAYEDLTTAPAQLKIVSDHVAIVGLTEGRYHQIKRMFGRFQNKVVKLHRFAIGQLNLSENLAEGECRLLTQEEVQNITKNKA